MLQRIGSQSKSAVTRRRGLLASVSAASSRCPAIGNASFLAPVAAQRAAQLGTMKDMMFRAAIDHVTSSITNESVDKRASAAGLAVNELQDAEDADTWRAIVVRPWR